MMRLEDVGSFEQLDALLAQGKISEDEYHDLWNALKGSHGEAPAEPRKKWWLFPGVSDTMGLNIAVDIWVVSLVVGLAGLLSGRTSLCMIGIGSSLGLYIAASLSKGGTPRQRRILKWSALAAAIVLVSIIGIGRRVDASRDEARMRQLRNEYMPRPSQQDVQPSSVE